MSVAVIGQIGHLNMSLQRVCKYFVMNRVVIEGFIHENVDIFIWGNSRWFLVKDVKIRFCLGSASQNLNH